MKRPRSISKAALCLFSIYTILLFRIDTVLAVNIPVKQLGCANLDIDEIAKLVSIELSGTTKPDGEYDKLVVQLKCHDEIVDIFVFDSLSDKSAQRSIVPIKQKLNERVVALSISQLIAVSRTKSQTSLEPKEQSDKTKPANDDSQASQVAAKVPSSVRINSNTKERAIFITGGGKLRSNISLAVANIGAKSDLLFTSNFGVAFILEFEAGSASRDQGTVTTMAVLWGVGPVGRFFRSELFFLRIGIEALMGYAHLKGNPETWASGKSAGGMTGEFSILAAPTLRLNKTLLSINLKGGYTLENPVGYIAAEDQITIGGFWIGADLCLGFRIGRGTND